MNKQLIVGNYNGKLEMVVLKRDGNLVVVKVVIILRQYHPKKTISRG